MWFLFYRPSHRCAVSSPAVVSEAGALGKATGSSVGHRMDLVPSPNTVVPFANSKVELEEWREHGCLRKRKWTS